MKFDGHVKLTRKAIAKMKTKCPVTTGSCRAPMFKDDFRLWLGNGKKSNSVDNYTAAIFNYITNNITPDGISAVKLPDAVAFVDLDERWTHDDPKGQRYHFMRAVNESNQAAFYNAARFIHTHTLNWVKTARKILKYESAVYRDKTVRPLQQSGIGLNNYYVKELALALHCLQDSFSLSHTDRYFGHKRNSSISTVKQINTRKIMPIRNLHVYAKQNHAKHGFNDYDSGGINSAFGKLAIDASADLMLLGIKSLWKDDRGLVDWGKFSGKWLVGSLI